MGVLDRDRTPASRELVRRMTSSGFIVEAARLADRGEIEAGVPPEPLPGGARRPARVRGTARPRRDSPCRCSSTAPTARPPPPSTTTSAAVLAQVDRAARAAPERAAAGRRRRARASGSTPSWRARTSVVPGLVALVLMMICALLTSIAITREKETGTLEQVLTTPVPPRQVIVGKLAAVRRRSARWTRRCAGVGRRGLRRADGGVLVWALAAYSLLFVLIALALGLLVSAARLEPARGDDAALMATYLPTHAPLGVRLRPSPACRHRCRSSARPCPPRTTCGSCGASCSRAALVPGTAILAAMAVVILMAAASFRLRLE